MATPQTSFDPDLIISRVTKYIFGGSVGIIITTMILSAAGTTPEGNLTRWVLWAGLGTAAVCVLLLRESPKEFGFRLPSGRWVRDVLFVIAFTIPLMVLLARMPVFESYYTVHYDSFWLAIWGLVGQTALHYFFEEFLIHGFLFFGLLRRIGKTWATIWVSIVFTVLHIGKPGWELLLAAVYSVIFCWLSLRSKSFIPAAFVHFVMSLVLNVLVAYVWLGPAATSVKY